MQKIGLVDTFTITEAIRLKEHFRNLSARVHIWTKDHQLKSHEPDADAERYLG